MLFLNNRKWFIIRKIRCAKDIKSVTPKTIETVFITFFPDNFAEVKKVIIMKKIYSIVILFLATFGIAYSSSLNTEGSDFVTEVIIVRDLPARANPHAPEKNPTVFQAYAIGTSNCLVIYSNKTVNTLISVENQTTGDCSDYTVSISTSPITIDLFGSGVYHLTLQLSDGKTYYGDFEI